MLLLLLLLLCTHKIVKLAHFASKFVKYVKKSNQCACTSNYSCQCIYGECNKGTVNIFVQVTSQKDQEQYWDRCHPYRYISVKHFAELFRTFHVGKRMAAELEVPYDKERSHKAALSFYRYSVSSWELFKANFAKEWLLMKRNSFVYIFKTVQVWV